MAERKLNVFSESDRIGELREGSGIWRFKYDSTWIAAPSSFSIAPGLPIQEDEITDSGSIRPVQWFFDNLLPEEGLREQLAKEKKTSAADAFGLLEQYGAESAGALTLLTPESKWKDGGRKALSAEDLVARIRDLPHHSLESKAPKKMSLAGAQHKLPIILEKDLLFEPEGSEPSTHILKPNHRNSTLYPHSTANEWFTMQLAAKVGLVVPETLHRYLPQKDSANGHEAVFIIQRFDREVQQGRAVRIHSIDACQLLNLDRSFKYSEMSPDALGAIAEATRMRAITRLRLFRWTVFNAAVGNADAHLKNLSFLVRADGIELAPHYDMLSTVVFDSGEKPAEWSKVKMSIQIGESKIFADVSKKDFESLADALKIKRDIALATLEKLVRDISLKSDALISEFEKSPFPASASAIRAGEMRVLRQIHHLPIREMATQLG